jgi:hypothetical protein
MVAIAFDELGAAAGGEFGPEYINFRFGVMVDAWGTAEQPYLNWNEAPYIGTGFNMRSSFSNFQLIAQGVLGANYSASLARQLWGDAVNLDYAQGQNNLLRNRMHQVLEDWATTNNIDMNTWFEFTSNAQMKDVLTDLGTAVEFQLDDWSDFQMPWSEEKAAIFSVAFEGVNIDDIMIAVLIDSDRFQAWYEIRYDTNNGGDKQNTAARRYVQSDHFELYNDPTSVGYAEAFDVARGYQDNRNAILAYEDKYQPAGAQGANGQGAAGLSGSINDQLQPAIKAIGKHFNLALGHLEEVLFARKSAPNLAGDGTGFDTKQNNDDLLIGDSEDNTITGAQGNDVILGLGGNDDLTGGLDNDRVYGGTGSDLLKGALDKDRLYGNDGGDRLEGGDGNDLLRGGNGNDILLGGEGNDILYGDGNKDTLKGEGGNDTYFLLTDTPTAPEPDTDPEPDPNPSLTGGGNADEIVEAKNGGLDTVVIGVAGDFNIKNVEKFRLSGDINGNVAVVLNQFDSFRLTGQDDTLTLTINKLQKDAIDIFTGGGADTVRIKLSPGIDPSQVLDGKGLTARFDFADLSAQDTIDLTSIGIKKIVMTDLDISNDQGFYLMAPDAQIHLMSGNEETKTYTNDTNSWFVVKCGDKTPYGPEFVGDIDKTNFDI